MQIYDQKVKEQSQLILIMIKNMMVLIVWNLDLHSENIEDSYSGAFDKQFGDYYIVSET